MRVRVRLRVRVRVREVSKEVNDGGAERNTPAQSSPSAWENKQLTKCMTAFSPTKHNNHYCYCYYLLLTTYYYYY